MNAQLFPQARGTSHTEEPQFTLTHSTRQNPGFAGSALTLSHSLHLPCDSFHIPILPTSGFSFRAQIQYWNHHEVKLLSRNTSLLMLTFLNLVIQRDVLLPYFSNHIWPKMVSFLKYGNCWVPPYLSWQGWGWCREGFVSWESPTASEAEDSSAECQALWEDGDVAMHEPAFQRHWPRACTVLATTLTNTFSSLIKTKTTWLKERMNLFHRCNTKL